MKKDDYINELVNIGLNNSEAKVYYYLLKKKHFTAMEISKLAHIPTSKIYDIMTSLIQKGLCTETLGKVKKYSPVNPDSGFDNFYSELEEKKEKISQLIKGLSSLYLSTKEKTDPLDYIKVLRDKKTIVNSFTKLGEQSTQEVLGFVKRPFVMDFAKLGKNFKNLEEYDSLRKGVVRKTIHESSDLDDQVLLDAIKFFIQAGEETRVAYKLHLPFKMSIFDEKVAMFSLEDKLTDEMSVTSLIIEHPDFIKGLKRIFDLYWQNSLTFDEFLEKRKSKT